MVVTDLNYQILGSFLHNNKENNPQASTTEISITHLYLAGSSLSAEITSGGKSNLWVELQHSQCWSSPKASLKRGHKLFIWGGNPESIMMGRQTEAKSEG